uniref:Uncharacterized protein n=1 Tax=Trypanosoma congolense (strain IL3000) TaxID=1068625 RepID=G0V063_TRYCI|nr:conserved hypothetical protein [Trypanosoma congolense IL3000]
MEQPASLSVNAPPAPMIKRPPAPKLTYEEVRRMARVSVLEDFYRQKEYHRRVERAHIAGTNVHVIPAAAAAMSGAALSKEGDTRLLKEHTSASWGVHLYQWSLFGLTGVSSVSSAMGFYLTIYHNRMFLPVGPMMAVVAWRFWNALESAWEEQRFIDNAARIRDSRKGNPMNLVVKRAAKGSADSVEPVECLS